MALVTLRKSGAFGPSPNPFRFLFALLRPRIGPGAGSRFGVRGGLAAVLVLLALAAPAPSGPAQAQITGLTVEPARAATVKVGVVLTFSGVGARVGTQIDRGLELFIRENPDAFGGHAVELVKRHARNPEGETARNAAWELVARKGVDILTGFGFSPNAIATAPVATDTKVPMILMGGSASWIQSLSRYIARVSFTTWQAGYPMGRYAYDNLGCKTGAAGYTDFSAGRDSGLAFRTGFEEVGGRFFASVAMGGTREVPDFAPFLRLVGQAGPDCLWAFVPAGPHSAAFLKAYFAAALQERGIRLIGPGAFTQIARLWEMGEEMVGLVTMHHYSADYDTPINRAFLAAWKKAHGAAATPGFFAVGGWDGMAAIAHAIKEQDGIVTAEGTMKVLVGWRHESPRGPIEIDAETRDIVHDQHVHEVVRHGAHAGRAELDRLPPQPATRLPEAARSA